VSGSSGAWFILKPWLGLVAAITAGAIAHQFGAEGTFDDCRAISPGPLLIVAILCLAAAVAGAWVSSQVARAPSEDASRRLVGVISVGFAALAGFATVIPMVASLMLPPCFQ
jgi:hypothetical protein